MLTFKDDLLHAVDASIQLKHKSTKDYALICIREGEYLFLMGCLSLACSNGLRLEGLDALKHLAEILNISEDRALYALDSTEDIKFDHQHYTITSMPFFLWQDHDGEDIVTTYSIPKDINKLSLEDTLNNQIAMDAQ